MPLLTSFARLGLFTTFAAVLAGACGGQSITNGGGGEAGSGAGDTGGSAHGGSTSVSGTAGKGHAGTGAGGSSAGSGAGGTGGPPPSEECGAPPSSGSCEAYIPSWYNDPSTGICRPFVYGGCGGNANRYPSLEACQKACSGGSPNYDACKVPSDCLVTGTDCCGVCDGSAITAHDLIAYNKQYADLITCGVALDIAAGGAASAGASAPIACGPCAALPPDQGVLQYFVPDCVAGQCVVADLRTNAVTACHSDNECKLRHGTGCCEGCGGDLFSVRNDGSFEKLVCGEAPVACPACAPAPTDAVAYCSADSRCAFTLPL